MDQSWSWQRHLPLLEMHERTSLAGRTLTAGSAGVPVPAAMASKRSAANELRPEPLRKRRAMGAGVSWQRSSAAPLATVGRQTW